MRKRKKEWVAIFATLFILAGLLLAVFLLPGELIYEGKTVLGWAMELESPEPQVRIRAEQTICRIGAAAIPDLVRAVNSKDPVWEKPYLAISDYLPRVLRKFLLQTLRPWKTTQERVAALDALKVLGPVSAPALPDLARALRDSNVVISWRAAAAMMQLRSLALAELVQAAQETNSLARNAALDSLLKLGPEASAGVPGLIRLLQDPDSQMVERVIRVIANVGKPAVPALTRTLASPDSATRERAASALGQIGLLAREAIPELMEATGDAQASVRRAAAEALGKIRPGSPEVTDKLVSKLHDPDQEVRLAAIAGLGKSVQATQRAAAALRETLNDPSPAVREQAAKLVGPLTPAK